jgi:hypothetical protein
MIKEKYSNFIDEILLNDKSAYYFNKNFNFDKKTIIGIRKSGIIKIKDRYFYKTDEAIALKKFIEYYEKNENSTLREAFNKFKVPHTNADRWLLKLKVKKHTENNLIKVNRNLFNKIDSNDIAYWLGFILADGNIFRNELRIKLGIKDKLHVKKFCNFAKINKKFIKYSIHKITQNKLVKINIYSKTVISNLKKLGINERKSTKEKPIKMKQKYIKHFIRGIFDGDGYYTKSGTNMGWVGSKELLTYIEKFLRKKLFLKQRPVYFKKSSSQEFPLYYLEYYSKKDKELVSNYLYKYSKKRNRLKRKYDLFKKFYAVS